MSKSSKPKPPIRFKATCRMKAQVAERRMTPAQWERANAVGFERVFVQLDSERINREPGPDRGRHGRYEIRYASCEGFETADAAEFERHMADLHGRRKLSVPVMHPRWRAPKLQPDGAALKTDFETRTCPTCGLIAETESNTAELWFAEHRAGCALAAQAAS